MNELINRTEKEGQQIVSTQELHELLESKGIFSVWFSREFDYGYIQRVDNVGV